MDDNAFDDILKRKLTNFEDPVFDPSALSQLHHSMALVSKMPWYSRYASELRIGTGILLCTLLILWSQWYSISRETSLFEETVKKVQSQQTHIDQLEKEISYLKSFPADTVYMRTGYGENYSHNNTLMLRIASLENQIHDIKASGTVAAEKDFPITFDGGHQMNSTLSENDGTNVFSTKVEARTIRGASMRAIPGEQENLKTFETSFSVKTTRDLERHYQNGIGVRVGPSIELSKGFYDKGQGSIDILPGVMGEFILSPSLSIETGAKYMHRFYEVSNPDDLSKMDLPYVDKNLGAVITADFDSWIFEIPLHFKYRYPIAPKTYALTGIGYSALLYTKQVFEYDYRLDGNPNARINSSHKSLTPEFYPGTLNISLGFSRQLKNNKILETSLYYQHGIGDLGMEKMQSDFLGLRATYWFVLR